MPLPKRNPEGNPTRNAVNLFSLLVFSGRAYSLKRLSEILDCSRQTVLRLIEQIDMSGRVAVRKWKEDGQSYYQIQTVPNRPKKKNLSKQLKRRRSYWKTMKTGQGPFSHLDNVRSKARSITPLMKKYWSD